MTDADLISALTAERDKAVADLFRAISWIEAWRVLRQAEIDRYRAALQPFAAAYRRSLPPSEGGYGDTDPVSLSLSDCQLAALALDLAR